MAGRGRRGRPGVVCPAPDVEKWLALDGIPRSHSGGWAGGPLTNISAIVSFTLG